MYEKFYGFTEKPFQMVPNPGYLFMSSVHESALTYLEYGLMENLGFILLTGEVGTGKTTLIRYIMDQFESEKEIAVIFNTNVTVDELLCLILQSFEIEPEIGNKARNLELFYQFLIKRYAENTHVLLIIDEAQNLSDEALEEVRMLSNLQSDEHNLIQIMLVGQPELKEKLHQPKHNPFAQRIAVNFFLSGLNDKETNAYVAYRLEKAGGRPDIFSQEAKQMIYQASGGIPRSINLLCDASLVYGFGYEKDTIDTKVVEQVIKDKGGMGIGNKTKKNKILPSISSIHGNNQEVYVYLQSFDDKIQLLQRQVDELSGMILGLEKKTEDLRDDIADKLLIKERQKSDDVLAAYSRLKVKYDDLAKRQKIDFSKLEKMVKVKFVKDELEKWLKQISKNSGE